MSLGANSTRPLAGGRKDETKPMKKPQTRDQADALLKRKGQIQIALQQIAGRMNLRIQQAKDAATDAAAPLQQEDAAIEAALEAYFQAERASPGRVSGGTAPWTENRGAASGASDAAPDRPRSLQLTFGCLGLRARTAVELARGGTEPRVLEALGAAGLAEFVRLRRSINREAVRQATPEQRARLLACGLRVESRERFFCEPDLAALAPDGYAVRSRPRHGGRQAGPAAPADSTEPSAA